MIRDYKTGESLQYAFIEFETSQQCEAAYFKMENVRAVMRAGECSCVLSCAPIADSVVLASRVPR